MKNNLFKNLILVSVFTFLLFFLYSCKNENIQVNIKIDDTNIIYNKEKSFNIKNINEIENYLEIPKKSGFKFEKWVYKQNDEFKDFEKNIKLDKSLELYPVFKEAFEIIVYYDEKEETLLFFKNQELTINDFSKIQKENLVLDSLYLDKDLTREINFPLVLTNNLELYPKFIETKYITFNINNGKTIKTFKKDKNIEEKDLEFLNIENKVYILKNLENEEIKIPFVLSSNLEINVIYNDLYNLNILTNYENLNKTLKRPNGYNIELNEFVAEVYKNGFNIHLYSNEEFTHPLEFPIVINKNNLNVYVKYDKIFKLEVLYNEKLVINKEVIENIFEHDLEYDKHIYEKEGYKLTGFSLTENGEKIEFPYLLDKDTILYPIYKKIVNIEFNNSYEYGYEFTTIVLLEDEFLDLDFLKKLPEKEGYNFVGFYLDENFINKIELPYKIGSLDLIIFAKFEKITE